MRYEIIGGRSFGRTGDRGREPAGAEDGEFVFVSGWQLDQLKSGPKGFSPNGDSPSGN